MEDHCESVPLSTSEKMTKSDGELLDKATSIYTYLIGSLLCLSVSTSPDIAQGVGAMSKWMAEPTMVHWQLCTEHSQTLSSHLISGLGRRSTTGYVFILHGGAITWMSKRQSAVADCLNDGSRVRRGSTGNQGGPMAPCAALVGVSVNTFPVVADTQSALKLLKNPGMSKRSKHIDAVDHFARERVARRDGDFSYIWTDEMLIDIR